jgi:uncharacterized membrane protein YdbT with pleckstrin-like domain
MGYVDENLMPGEKVVCKAKIHWLIFGRGVVLFLVGVLLLIMYGDLLILLLGVVFLIYAVIKRSSTELAVTSKRVIVKTGLFSRKTMELNHTKVESFYVEQGIFGRIFGFGTVTVNGTGGGSVPVTFIDSPLEFRRKAMETIDASQLRQA